MGSSSCLCARDVNEARSVRGRGRGHKVEAKAEAEAKTKCYEAEAGRHETEAEAEAVVSQGRERGRGQFFGPQNRGRSEDLTSLLVLCANQIRCG